MVFVLDQKKHPLMPCTPKRARLLLARGRAVVHRVAPFVIRLKDRRMEDSILQPLALKIDRVRAVVPAKLKTAGIHVGRVQVRKSGSFSIKTRDRDIDGISAMYFRLIQRGDGYSYAIA